MQLLIPKSDVVAWKSNCSLYHNGNMGNYWQKGFVMLRVDV